MRILFTNLKTYTMEEYDYAYAEAAQREAEKEAHFDQMRHEAEFEALELEAVTVEDLKLGILHSRRGYWVSNEGTKSNPSFHVWIPGITHSTCDSAYSDLSLAVSRCDYLAFHSA